jgi:hypothetical protein
VGLITAKTAAPLLNRNNTYEIQCPVKGDALPNEVSLVKVCHVTIEKSSVCRGEISNISMICAINCIECLYYSL